MFIDFNNNPYGIKEEDCAIRSISKATGKPWEKVYMDLAVLGLTKGRMPSSKSTCHSYLKKLGFTREIIPDSCPDCYTIEDFCRDYSSGSYILATDDHLVAVIDGNIYDTWNSAKEIPMFYWKKGEV